MLRNPEEEASEEAQTRRLGVSRKRLRAWTLVLALLALTVYAATTDSLGLLTEWAMRGPSHELRTTARAETRGRPPNRGSTHNGFDVSNATIPIGEIRSGGPPRDGIPSIDEPRFLPASEVDYLRDADEVVGFIEQGKARAYPLRILVWHEIVNDTVGGRPIAVTYCPLCGTCMVFDRRYAGKELTFGVSGLLYNSDVLMYDRQTESLWSQLEMAAVSGPQVGEKMLWLPSEQMTWAAWKQRYPGSEVLSTATGHGRTYDRMPYAGYEQMERTMFPVPKHRDELRNKEWVIGVVVDGLPKAYPIAELEKLGDASLDDVVGQSALKISYDAAARRAEVKDGTSGNMVPNVRVYWFAWQAFYPGTELYSHD